jgi:hypothetical protein
MNLTNCISEVIERLSVGDLCFCQTEELLECSELHNLQESASPEAKRKRFKLSIANVVQFTLTES